MLDTWDAEILARFDALWSSPPAESAACRLTITGDCLARLDQTLNELRERGRQHSGVAVACGPELTALRSAAVEVAAGAYVQGLKRRRRHGGATSVDGPRRVDERTPASPALRAAIDERRQGACRPIVCLVSPELLAELDDMLADVPVLGEAGPHADRRPEPALEEMRSMVVEAAIAAWLMLRTHSAVSLAERRPRGWLDSVRQLVARRRRGTR